MKPRFEKMSMNRKTPASNRELFIRRGTRKAQPNETAYTASSMRNIISIWPIRPGVTGTCILSRIRHGRVIFTSRPERPVTPLRVITPDLKAAKPVAIMINRVRILNITGKISMACCSRCRDQISAGDLKKVRVGGMQRTSPFPSCRHKAALPDCPYDTGYPVSPIPENRGRGSTT
jgi:hypothetical protein